MHFKAIDTDIRNPSTLQDLNDFTQWVKSVWVDGGRVQQQTDDHPARLKFLQLAEATFKKAGVNFDYVKTWVVCQKAEPGEGFIDGHPHTHAPPHATTLVYYLTDGAPIDVEGALIYPEPGKVIMFSNDTLHGVHKHQGDDRLALIATAI